MTYWSINAQYMTTLHLQSYTENFWEAPGGKKILSPSEEVIRTGAAAYNTHHIATYHRPQRFRVPSFAPCTSRWMFIITCPPLASGWGPATFLRATAIRDSLSIKCPDIGKTCRCVCVCKCAPSAGIKTITNNARARERSGVCISLTEATSISNVCVSLLDQVDGCINSQRVLKLMRWFQWAIWPMDWTMGPRGHEYTHPHASTHTHTNR